MKTSGLLILFVFVPAFLWGQKCTITVSGYASDISTQTPLAYATVYLESGQKAAITDENGYFKIEGLCSDTTHIRITHINCQMFRQFLVIKKDTVLHFSLSHHDEMIDEVHIHGEKSNTTTTVTNTLGQNQILKKSNKDLSEVLEGITGVNLLKTGSGISKPIIHGLYGNRIALLNNGLSQGGQQWGNDHAPEIDPFAADHISVIKGAAALAYAGKSLGGIVLVEPGETNNDPHYHGILNYYFQSNGLGNTLNAEVNKGGEKMGVLLKGTLKYRGDLKAPDYFLTNTGKREGNISALIEFSKDKSWKKSVYLSSFNTEMGILRGSHIGNITDLESAMGREVPFFTSESFSYKINAPSQKVNHQLLKLSTIGKLSKNQGLKINYGVQLNARKEYDVRRSGRSDKPAMSLRQWTHQLDFSYDRELQKGNYIKTGFIGQYIDNTNVPETGILPLIPDYTEYNESLFFIYQKDWAKWFFEIGGRGDMLQYEVWEITQTIPHEVLNHKHDYINGSLSGGLKYKPVKKLTLNANFGTTKRPPAINELYSYGLHQGVSSIEVGSPTLSSEQSYKGIVSVDIKPSHSFLAQISTYYQKIDNFIFLQPSLEPLLTIRGAFPLFNYKQTDAVIRGFEAMVSYEPIEAIRWVSKASIIKGDDISNDIPLVYMPSYNLHQRLEMGLGKIGKIQNPQMVLNWQTVFKQKHLNQDQDFLTPPPTYNVFRLEVNGGFFLKKRELNFSFQVNNLFNTEYTDYLNRQRYFASEPGRSIDFNIVWKF